MRRRDVETEVERLAREQAADRASDVVDEEWWAERHVHTRPPWRHRLPDGTLGPWYGPRSEGAYLKAKREHESVQYWDREKEAPRAPTPQALERHDSTKVLSFLKVQGHKFTFRELQVVMAFYVDGKRKGDIARDLGMSRSRVDNLLQQARKRVKERRA